tara:strand:- start:477 stop:611 length:135 start_codon:yes stop_codon:yes gene_type:complete
MTLSESLKKDLEAVEIALQKCDSILNNNSEEQEENIPLWKLNID